MAKQGSFDKAFYKRLIAQANDEIEKQNRARIYEQVLTAGKEFSMLFAWLGYYEVKPVEGVPLALASLLKDYPKALKESMAYNEELKEYDIRKNLKSVTPRIIDGVLLFHFDWHTLKMCDDPGDTSTKQVQE